MIGRWFIGGFLPGLFTSTIKTIGTGIEFHALVRNQHFRKSEESNQWVENKGTIFRHFPPNERSDEN